MSSQSDPNNQPPLCAGGCGFYGDALTGMCSVCRKKAGIKTEPTKQVDSGAKPVSLETAPLDPFTEDSPTEGEKVFFQYCFFILELFL